jgi:salicylate hydroxylase
MSTNRNDVDVVIVGGGIGGLSSAVALIRKGLKVRVLERAAEFGELDHWGLLAEVELLGVAPRTMVMFDAMDGQELTRLDLTSVAERYGYPYLVIHRSDLHGTLLRAARRLGADLVTSATCVGVEQTDDGATAVFADGRRETAELVVAADGMHSVARALLVDDQPVSSAYVAYRGAIPIEAARANDIHEDAVVLYVGPRRHFVQYPLRSGQMFNQVAVFQSPRALAGEEDWGTPDELDAAFAGSCAQVRAGLPLMWRDRWWRMFDRDPIDSYVAGRIVLAGDAAHPPLQYMAQGAIMAMEDAHVLAEHVGRQAFVPAGPGRPAGHPTGIDWAQATAAYDAVRPQHCRRVLTTGRAWGDLWHVDGEAREIRNALLRARDVDDYHFTDWIWGPTALTPEDEPPPYRTIPLSWSSVAERVPETA